MKKYDKPDTVISTEQGGMSSKEAAVSALVDWFKDNMYVQADQTGKLSDDLVVDKIINIINERTKSREKRKVWYRGGVTKDSKGTIILNVSESDSTKSIFKVEECGKVEEPLIFAEGIWHNPVDNPRRTKYNSFATIKPQNGAFGKVRINSRGGFHSGLDLFGIPEIDKVYACLDSKLILNKDKGGLNGYMIQLEIINTKDLLKQMQLVDYKLEYNANGEWLAAETSNKTHIKLNRELNEADTIIMSYVHLDYSQIVLTQGIVDEINKNGGIIKAGTHIGYLGVTGNADGIPSPHLHFEIRIKGSKNIRLNPAKFIKLNPYNTKDQDDASKKQWKPKPKDKNNLL